MKMKYYKKYQEYFVKALFKDYQPNNINDIISKFKEPFKNYFILT